MGLKEKIQTILNGERFRRLLGGDRNLLFVSKI
jgi:hypothetical protein